MNPVYRPSPFLGVLIILVLVLVFAEPAMAQPPEEEKKGGAITRIKGIFDRGEDGGSEEEEAEGEENEEGERGFFKGWLEGPDVEGILITPLEDVGREYEIVFLFPAVAYREYGGASGSRPLGGLADPVLVSVDRAIKDLGAYAKENGGDAVLGLTIEFQNQSGGEEGRVIAYGTVVRWKGNAAAIGTN